MRLLTHAIKSAFFGALGPLFNKLAAWDPSKPIAQYFADRGLPYWSLVVFNVVCLLLMLTFNTAAVKYKMLSYKEEGAFLGTTLIFSLGYLFSTVFGWVIGEQDLPPLKFLGFLLILVGVMFVTSERTDTLSPQATDKPSGTGVKAVEDIVLSGLPTYPLGPVETTDTDKDLQTIESGRIEMRGADIPVTPILHVASPEEDKLNTHPGSPGKASQ